MKSAAERHVKSGQGYIRDAQVLFNFCQSNLAIDGSDGSHCQHRNRIFSYEEQINRVEPAEKLVPGPVEDQTTAFSQKCKCCMPCYKKVTLFLSTKAKATNYNVFIHT